MLVKVIKEFIDLENNDIERKIGEEIKVTKERYEKIKNFVKEIAPNNKEEKSNEKEINSKAKEIL